MRTLINVVLFVVVLVLFGSVVPVSAHAEAAVQDQCDVRLVSQRAEKDGVSWFLNTLWAVSTDDRIRRIYWEYEVHYTSSTDDRSSNHRQTDNVFADYPGARVRDRIHLTYASYADSVYDVDVPYGDPNCYR